MPLNDSNQTYGNDVTTVSDIINESATYGTITVTTTPIEVKVGVNKLTNRKLIIVQARASGIYYGFTNSVTQTNGIELVNGDILFLPVGENVSVWLVANTGSKNARIQELA